MCQMRSDRQNGKRLPIIYTGDRYDRGAAYCTDTQNLSKSIPLTRVDCLLESAPENAKIVVIELAENAISLADFKHPENAYYVFGPEDGSVKQKVLNQNLWKMSLPLLKILPM